MFLLQGIEFSEETRRHPIWEKYYKKMMIKVCIDNDFFSMKKERKEGTLENIVLRKKPEITAIRTVVEEVQSTYYEALIKDIGDLEAEIKQCSSLPANIPRAVQCLKKWSNGYIFWERNSSRNVGNKK